MRIRDELGRIIGDIPDRQCLWCGTSLNHRRADARWCSVAHRTYWVREQRRRARRFEHPRCAVCDGPMPYGKPSFNLSSVTCSVKCRRLRHRWFNTPANVNPRISAEHRRAIAVRAAAIRWGYLAA